MLIVISPAKALDFERALPGDLPATQPDFLDQAEQLIRILRKKTLAEIASLMDLSDPLAALNLARYESWSRPFTNKNARQAIFAFNGDVYDGLDAISLDSAQLAFAQRHLRSLSGLYGVLRPLDLMQAYRLEMGARLVNAVGKDLYAFWGDAITNTLNQEIAALAQAGEAAILVNLASEEYFKSVRPKKLAARVITPVFEDRKGTSYKVISFYAKRARGLMSRFAIVNGITDVELLKEFNAENYVFEPKASDDAKWVFRRDIAERAL